MDTLVTDETTPASNMTYNDRHVLPSTAYAISETDVVTYSTVDDVTSCVDGSSSSQIIVYNYVTKICMFVATRAVNINRFQRNYYATVFLPTVGKHCPKLTFEQAYIACPVILLHFMLFGVYIGKYSII